VAKVVSAKVVAVEAASTLVAVVSEIREWEVLVALDFTCLTEDVAWWKWLVALVAEPAGLVTDTLDSSTIFNLVRILNTVLTVVCAIVVTAEAKIVADSLVVATVWASPVSIAYTARAVVSGVLNTGSLVVGVGWSVTVLHAWVA
jgi:hypothetical protein